MYGTIWNYPPRSNIHHQEYETVLGSGIPT